MNPRLRAGLVALAFSAHAAWAAAPAVPTLSPGELRAGQRATVRTVFAGDSIETFDAEIVGVLRGGRAEGDLILARATSPKAVASGVAQGMSGSPVYVDGKLVGALSSGWAFSREPIFGITPIGEMLSVLDQPESPGGAPTTGPSGVDAAPPARPGRFRELRWTDADEDAPSALPAAPDRPAALPLPLAAGGLNPGALAAVREAFEPLGLNVVPGGRAGPAKAGGDPLRPGAAVAVDILRGDLNLSAIGTVTYRDGDRVLIFGHPFFQSGEVRLPLSTADIVTVLPSLANSFKLGVPGRPIGVVTQDRRAAVAGRLGGVPRLMPLAVDVRRAGRIERFRFESIEDRSLLPQLVATAALNSLLESGGNGPQQSLRWTLTLHPHGAAPVVLGDAAVGDGPFADLTTAIGAPLRFLANNPYRRLALDSVAVRVDVEPGREQWTLRAAGLPAASVRPGGVLRVACQLERWRGGVETRTIELSVPRELPEGRYVLFVGGGGETSRYDAQRRPGRYRPTSLDDAFRRFAELRRTDAVYASLWARAPEVTSNGDDYPELPGSALAILLSPLRPGDEAQRTDWALVEEARAAQDGAVRGQLLLEVNVDPKAP